MTVDRSRGHIKNMSISNTKARTIFAYRFSLSDIASQTELASICDCERKKVGRLINGRIPKNVMDYLKMMDLIGVTVEEAIRYSENGA